MMRPATILAVLALLTIPALAQPPQPKPDCTLKRAAGVDMQTLVDGRVVIPVKLNGQDYKLMVDTGGFVSTVSASVAKALELKPQSAGVYASGMGTRGLTKFVTMADLAIDSLHGRNFKVYIDSFSSTQWDGTLAPEIMRAYDTDLDFAHEKFSLFSPDHCPGQVVYWTDHDIAIVPMSITTSGHVNVSASIDGHELKATFDSGSDLSFIGMRQAISSLGIKEDDPLLKSLGIKNINGQADEVFTYPFKTINIGGITVSKPHIEIVSRKVMNDLDFDILLGVGVMRQLHMYIAYKEKKLYLTAAQAGPTPQ